jgi:hypothetical protein
VDGKRCTACLGRGVEIITTCPRELITADAEVAIEAAELVEIGGGWPIEGGWLNQTAACVEAVRIVRAEQAYWKAHFGIRK